MKKAKAFLNLSKASVNDIKLKAKMIVTKMTSNASFTTPAPALTAITAQIDLVTTKQAEQDAAFQTYQQKTKELGSEKDNLLNILDTERTYVETIANGDESKILSAGFDTKQPPTPIGELDAPKNMLAEEGGKAGEIMCTWKTVKGAKSYNVDQSTDISNADAWEHAVTVTKAKCVISNLAPGTRMWFRVAAIGSAGQSGFSDVTTKIVP
jgi:hypothetical protein